MQIPQDEAQPIAEENVAPEGAVEESAEDQAVAEADAEAEAPEGEEAEPSAEQPRLIVKRSGAETEEVFAVAPPAVIGRFDPSVGPIDIDLGGLPEGQYVSRKHAMITLEEGVWKISDLGSSNGTYVLRDDFERVEEADINDGTEIALGNARFVFRT